MGPGQFALQNIIWTDFVMILQWEILGRRFMVRGTMNCSLNGGSNSSRVNTIKGAILEWANMAQIEAIVFG